MRLINVRRAQKPIVDTPEGEKELEREPPRKRRRADRVLRYIVSAEHSSPFFFLLLFGTHGDHGQGASFCSVLWTRRDVEVLRLFFFLPFFPGAAILPETTIATPKTETSSAHGRCTSPLLPLPAASCPSLHASQLADASGIVRH
jgi:hypothetical protein